MEVLFEKIEKLEEKIKGNPKDSELYLELAVLFIDCRDNKAYKRDSKIIQNLEKYQGKLITIGEELLKEDSNDYDVLRYLSELYLQKDIDKALDYGQRAFKIDKGNENRDYNLSYLYERKKEHKKLFLKIEKLEEKIKENPKDSELYLELGDLCISSRNNKVYEKGMRVFREAFSLNPSSQLANEIAKTYEYSDKIACAYRYRVKAIKLEPNNLDNYIELFETLDYYVELLWHYNPDDKDTPKKVEKVFEKLKKYELKAVSLLKTESKDYDVLYSLFELYLQKDIDKALDYAKRAFEIDKKAYHNVSYLYERKKDYKKLIELHLSMGEYYENGESCKDKLKDYHKAIECYKKAFALNPSSQIATKIADTYECDEKVVCAYSYRLKAIKLEPNNLDNYVELFETLDYYVELLWHYNPDDKDTPKKEKKALEKLEKYRAMAISIGEKILKENPNDYDVLCRLSDLYFEEDDDKALDYSQRAFEIDKENDKAYSQLSYFYAIKENHKKLIELYLIKGYYSAAGNIYMHDLRDYPKAIECYLNVGNYHEAGNIYKFDLKDYPKAIECYKKAVESDDKNFTYLQSLGCTLNYIKEHEKALHYLQIAKELKPNHINSYNNLVYVYNDLGNYEEVRKNLNIAYKMNPNNSVTLITKMEIDLILDNSIDKNLEDKILELFSENTEVMGEYSMLKILFNITQNKDMKDELLKWKEEYERLPDSYSLVGLENWAKKQDEDLQDRLLEALRVFK